MFLTSVMRVNRTFQSCQSNVSIMSLYLRLQQQILETDREPEKIGVAISSETESVETALVGTLNQLVLQPSDTVASATVVTPCCEAIIQSTDPQITNNHTLSYTQESGLDKEVPHLERLPEKATAVMTDEGPPPSSPPIPMSKGSYQIDWDNFDDTVNPFKSRACLGSSPPSSGLEGALILPKPQAPLAIKKPSISKSSKLPNGRLKEEINGTAEGTVAQKRIKTPRSSPIVQQKASEPEPKMPENDQQPPLQESNLDIDPFKSSRKMAQSPPPSERKEAAGPIQTNDVVATETDVNSNNNCSVAEGLPVEDFIETKVDDKSGDENQQDFIEQPKEMR